MYAHLLPMTVWWELTLIIRENFPVYYCKPMKFVNAMILLKSLQMPKEYKFDHHNYTEQRQLALCAKMFDLLPKGCEVNPGSK